MSHGRVVVTGASTGIGEATARRLVEEGYDVIAVARRAGRLRELSRQTGCQFFPADLTNQERIDELVAFLGKDGPIKALVNVAGGAIGTDSVAEGNPEDWLTMYNMNVLATLRLTQALLPQLRARGGDVVFITSTAAHEPYKGGAGYTAAKHAELMIPQTLRLELVGEPVRVIEIAPGMVRTDEFSLHRLHGDAAAAERVYAGVAEPLTAQDVAGCVAWALELPAHVNIDSMIVRPRAQASNTLVAREV